MIPSTSNKTPHQVVSTLVRLGACDVASKIAEKHGVTLHQAMSDSRYKSIAAARHEIRSVVTSTLGLSLHDAARVFGCDHTTIYSSVVLRELEIVRDSPGLVDRARELLDTKAFRKFKGAVT